MARRLAHPARVAAVENPTEAAAKCLQWKQKAGGAEGCDSLRWRLGTGHGGTGSLAGRRPERMNRRGIGKMTISGHNRTMKQVRIAELKAQLSEHLRAVRRGETVTVLDRDTPVAQIVPVREQTALRIRKPAPGTPPLNRVPLPKPVGIKTDVVELLLEERQGSR